jgi:hypothetical protein
MSDGKQKNDESKSFVHLKGLSKTKKHRLSELKDSEAETEIRDYIEQDFDDAR